MKIFCVFVLAAVIAIVFFNRLFPFQLSILRKKFESYKKDFSKKLRYAKKADRLNIMFGCKSFNEAMAREEAISFLRLIQNEICQFDYQITNLPRLFWSDKSADELRILKAEIKEYIAQIKLGM